jgi:hypothetical protein
MAFSARDNHHRLRGSRFTQTNLAVRYGKHAEDTKDEKRKKGYARYKQLEGPKEEGHTDRILTEFRVQQEMQHHAGKMSLLRKINVVGVQPFRCRVLLTVHCS